MRILKDIDFMKWNERLDKSSYSISNTGEHTSSNGIVSQVLSFVQRSNIGGTSYSSVMPQNINIISDPFIKYDFTFSVVNNRKDDFFRIENILFNKGIHNKVRDLGGKDKVILLSRDIIKSKKELIHSIYDKEYIKYSYSMEGSLSSIVSYVTILEDTIEFFQKLWTYDGDGKEHVIIKYPIGSIVSKGTDKSRDYMVTEYDFVVDYDKYIINYVINEMVNSPNSLAIKYLGSETCKESDLCYSRTDRINNILN